MQNAIPKPNGWFGMPLSAAKRKTTAQSVKRFEFYAVTLRFAF